MIRIMTGDDVKEVAALERKIFSEPWSENVYRQTLALPETVYLVAVDESDNKIIGAAGVRNIVGTGEITNVMVDTEYRKRGIGRELVALILDEGKKIGVIEFTLEVRAGNKAAISLYESLGFAPEGIRPGFYRHPDEDALIMWNR